MMAVRNDAFATDAHILWRPLYFTGASIAVRATLATCLAVLLFWMTRVPLAFSADATASQTQSSIKTEHRLSEPGISLPYEAVAGTLTLRDEAGRPQFSIFYTEDRVDAKRGQGRPIIFLWNGGPGWSSIWLRMGSFGPVRVKPTAVGSTAPASLEENPYTLLPYADLVFLDAPETGYSRELPSARPSDYAGIDEDARVMTRAVEQYLDQNVAMGTAIYLLGESYGTLRAAVVARMLHDDGIQVSGLILMSCILGGGDLGDTRDRDYQTWLPTYAAIGAYYHKVAGSPAGAAARAEAFAETTYAKALFAGSSLSRQDERTIAGELADLTGLSADYWFDDHLRVPIETFRRDLMSDELGLSAHDARFAGPDFAPLGIRPSYDAFDVALRDKYVAAMHTYFHHDLNYTTTLQYRLSAPPVSWDNRHLFPGAHEPALDDDVRPDISMMLREEPNFRVLALSGLYDLVTPYFLTEYDLNHLDAPLATMSRVQNFRLNSGHMIYADPSASKTVSSLIRQFLGEGAS
jgi:carboxypeptidase C (cathepsin A)